MRIKHDDVEFEATYGFVVALENLVREEIKMMQQADPDNVDCWTWGVCHIGNLAYSGGLTFEFGGEEDRPEWLQGDVAVVAENETRED